MVRVISSIGNGSVYADDFLINSGVAIWSRNMIPTWDTSDRDRTQDALNWAIGSGDVISAGVYQQFKSAFDASGKKFVIGDVNAYIAEGKRAAELIALQKEQAQLALKTDYLNRNTGVWMSEAAAQAEVAETQAEITAYNNTLEAMAAQATQTIKTTAGKIPGGALWLIVGAVILLLFVLKRR